MDSASIQLVAFGLAVALISNFHRSPVWRSLVLGIATLVFLVLLVHSPLALLPMAGFLVLGYVCFCMVQAGWSRYQAALVLLIVLLYTWLKKYTFLPEASFLHFPYFTLGLSYIFFRVLHLVLDANNGPQKIRVNFWQYLLYTLNFTVFVSGPIQKYTEFAQDQFAVEPVPLGIRTVGMQLERIVRGFFKVNVMASLLYGLLQSSIAELHISLPFADTLRAELLVAILYPLFLYCNFSGYIDIVIALARLIRVRLPENFDRPFSATSLLEYWTRWHMSLSNWLKAYVYNPLLLNLMRRVSWRPVQPFVGVLCFFVTFFLIGVWHGRTSEYMVYGLSQGGGVALNKLWQIQMANMLGRKGYKELAANPFYAALSRGLTFTYIALTLFLFWAGWAQMRSIFGSASLLRWTMVWLIVWAGATVALAAWEWLRSAVLSVKTAEGPVLESRYVRMVYATALVVISAVILLALNQPAPDIVYKAF